MVEFALVAPLFFFVVFGGIEIGLMFRSYLALENATRSVARVASIERDNPDADNLILERIGQLADPLQGNVKWVVVYNAASLDAGPEDCAGPADATTGEETFVTGPGCNAYEITDGDLSQWDLGGPAATWIGEQRGPGQTVGIHVVFDYTYATGFFDTLTLSSTTVEVIEQDI